MGDEPEDPDRAAILGRRNRLIALALSGLGASAGCGDPAPAACLQPVVVEESEQPGRTGAEQTRRTDEAEPVPCLSTPPVDPATGEPVVRTEPGPGSTARDDQAQLEPVPCLSPLPPAQDDDAQPDEETPEHPPAPRPCLSVLPDHPPDDDPEVDEELTPVRPEPCLSAPRPCLTPPMRRKG